MKPMLFWGFLMLPFLGFSQRVDSVRVAKEVDSLVQVCRALTGQKKYEEALMVIEVAKEKAVEAFGVESVGYANCVSTKGRVYYFMQKYVEAEYWYLEANNIREKVLGLEHPDYAFELVNLALLYQYMGNYEKSEQLYFKAITIQEKTIGKEHPDYARSLNAIGGLYRETGRFEKAEPFIIEAKDIRKKILGEQDPSYAISLNTLANLYLRMGKYTKAESLYIESIAIFEKVFGKENQSYANPLSGLSVLYMETGAYEKAQPLMLEVLTIRGKALGKENPDYAVSVNNLALLYKLMGYYEKSEPLYLEVIDIRKRVLGKSHPDYASSLNNLANLYKAMGNFENAEPLMLNAIAIREKILGKEHPDYATSLSSLADLYERLGNYKIAESLSIEAKNIREKILGKEHPDYAASLSDLASLFVRLGDYNKAEPLYIEALNICGKFQGAENLVYAAYLGNLASLYERVGNYRKAESFFLETKTILGKVIEKENPTYIWCLNNLAVLYLNMGSFEKAEPLLLEAKNLREKVLGKEHPDFANTLEVLTGLYEKQNKFSTSEPLMIELSTLYQEQQRKAVNFLSGQELTNFSFMFQNWGNDLGAFLFARATNKLRNSILPSLAFENALFQKGFLLQSADRLNELTSAKSESQELNLRLKSYRRRLATEYSKPIAERKGIAELEEKANAAEKELARSVAGYADAVRQVSWQDVQSSLKKGEAAIEFVHFKVNFPKTTDSTMYAALLLRPLSARDSSKEGGNAAPQFIPLFEERQLTTLLKGASGKAYGLINALYDPESQPGDQKNLYDLIWKPIEAHLNGVQTVYCAPSGLLHKINLGAIRLGGGKETFSDRYQLITLNSTRRLVLPDNTARTDHTAQLFGGIRYTTDSTAIAAANVKLEGTRGLADETLPFHSDSTLRGDAWNYLPETATEVRDIQHLFQSKNWSAQLDTGYLATEEAFRAMGNNTPSPRVLHIATHGFFYPDPKTSTNDKYRMMEGHEPVFKLSDHPMIRSGLLLAGAQEAWSTGKAPENREDGILTAYEISQMNLSNTELVVLSACETGLGDIEGNEGVYGLQRAFKIAGAKYLIMSLWKVSDRSSRALMTEFYRQWLDQGLSIPDAFRKAQGMMKQKYPDAPYHWAGFVLVE